ncbi:hypothetical protein CBM2592_B130130 [Cupriavidus taiwanensis]|nr:hypothetical protein CBM2592_B130130 [Cupriavidus taiwanensis]SOY94366.1 hypothetical protein CBM2591_B120127 [Cupriavidus taiwanensis]SPD57786.1 protein of unknown function [Cupriavidus taiwanensis]
MRTGAPARRRRNGPSSPAVAAAPASCQRCRCPPTAPSCNRSRPRPRRRQAGRGRPAWRTVRAGRACRPAHARTARRRRAAPAAGWPAWAATPPGRRRAALRRVRRCRGRRRNAAHRRVRPGHQPHAAQGVVDAVALLREQAPRLQPERDVVPDPAPWIQRGILEHHDARGIRLGDGHAILPDFSRGGLVQARDQAQQRGLAAAAGAEQGDEFTRRDGEVDVVEYRQPVGAVAKPVADLPDIDAGAGSCCRVINCRRVNSPLPRAGEGLRERASVCSTNTA